MVTTDRSPRWAAAAGHLSAPLVAVAALLLVRGPVVLALAASPLGPIVVALVARRTPLFVRTHVREALRFSLTVAFAAIGVALASLAAVRVDAAEPVFAVLGFLGLLLAWLWASFTVVATRRALQAREWRYPFVPGRRRRVG